MGASGSRPLYLDPELGRGVQTVEKLPKLTRLNMPSPEIAHRDLLTPRCHDLAKLRSWSLQDLSLQVLKLEAGVEVGSRSQSGPQPGAFQ